MHFHLGSLAYADHATLELFNEWEERRTGRVVVEWDEWKARSGKGLVLPDLNLNPVQVPSAAQGELIQKIA